MLNPNSNRSELVLSAQVVLNPSDPFSCFILSSGFTVGVAHDHRPQQGHSLLAASLRRTGSLESLLFPYVSLWEGHELTQKFGSELGLRLGSTLCVGDLFLFDLFHCRSGTESSTPLKP